MSAWTDPSELQFPDTFESERLVIRGPRAGDGALVTEAVNESLPELSPWLTWAQGPVDPDAQEARITACIAEFAARSDLELYLFERSSGLLVGKSGLHRMDWSVPRFEIGYWLRTRFRGRGLMTEAVERIARFAFETLGAQRVEIRTDDRNQRSWRIAERLGFVLEGVLRNEARDPAGGLRATRVYARVPGDPPMTFIQP